MSEITTHNEYENGEYIVEKEKVEDDVWRVEKTTVRVHYECGICRRDGDSPEDVEHSQSCPVRKRGGGDAES